MTRSHFLLYLWILLGFLPSALIAQNKNQSGKTTHREHLFGPALASYSITSSELKGAWYYVVSGHGGPDPGAVGKIGNEELHDDEYAADIVLRLARIEW